jgi:hypothetical protein
VHEIGAADATPFGQREDRRQHRRARCTARACVSSKSSTCELMPLISAACRMSRRSLRPRTPPAAAGEPGQRRERAFDGFMPRAADRAAGPVEERARRFMTHGAGISA